MASRHDLRCSASQGNAHSCRPRFGLGGRAGRKDRGDLVLGRAQDQVTRLKAKVMGVGMGQKCTVDARRHVASIAPLRRMPPGKGRFDVIPRDRAKGLRRPDKALTYFQWCQVATHAPDVEPHISLTSRCNFENDALFGEVSSSYLATVDKDWFKKALRKAGKTSGELAEAIGRDRAVVSRIMNGHQALTLEQAKQFATELGVDVAEVLTRAGMTDATVAAVFTPGFSDSDAAPWVGGPSDRATTDLATALGARPGIDIWQIKSHSMAMAGYLAGDLMLVDTHQAERVKAGDVVVAQVYDRHGGARTVLRRWLPPVLVAFAPPGEDEPIYLVDNNNVVIRGKVTASWRLAKN